MRRLITTSQVADFLRHVAYKVFNIPAGPLDHLAWSCNSICITAANLLHRARFSDSYKKNCLRWCKDTFLMFLRNTFYTADQHTKAIILSLDPPTLKLTRHLNNTNSGYTRAPPRTLASLPFILPA